MNQFSPTVLGDAELRRHAELYTFLEEICRDLELTHTQFEKAKTAYEAISDWLSKSTDPLLADILVYLQGSGALGTSVKPLGRDEFDVDLICLIIGVAASIAPAEIKRLIGVRLREHSTYEKILEEKKRCWRLNYAGDFHLDISPTIANPVCYNGGELVPDRKLREWHPTNPRGFKAVFERRAALRPRLARSIAEVQMRDQAAVEPFPAHQAVKGVLRRVVQLLKRHRDHYFLSVEEEIAPISIIITTLAMQAYEYCVKNFVFQSELDVLVETIRMMPHFIDRPLENGRQIYAVWNETTQGENFADRWNTEPARVQAFYAWHAQALVDFESLRDAKGLDSIVHGMERQFGSKVVGRVMDARTEKITAARKSQALYMAPAIGLSLTNSAVATPVPKNDFFGD